MVVTLGYGVLVTAILESVSRISIGGVRII